MVGICTAGFIEKHNWFLQEQNRIEDNTTLREATKITWLQCHNTAENAAAKTDKPPLTPWNLRFQWLLAQKCSKHPDGNTSHISSARPVPLQLLLHWWQRQCRRGRKCLGKWHPIPEACHSSRALPRFHLAVSIASTEEPEGSNLEVTLAKDKCCQANYTLLWGLESQLLGIYLLTVSCESGKKMVKPLTSSWLKQLTILAQVTRPVKVANPQCYQELQVSPTQLLGI